MPLCRCCLHFLTQGRCRIINRNSWWCRLKIKCFVGTIDTDSECINIAVKADSGPEPSPLKPIIPSPGLLLTPTFGRIPTIPPVYTPLLRTRCRITVDGSLCSIELSVIGIPSLPCLLDDRSIIVRFKNESALETGRSI